MSVKTEADEKLADAKSEINKAIENLNSIVVLRCDGWDEFNDEYYEKIKNTFQTLLSIRDEFDKNL